MTHALTARQRDILSFIETRLRRDRCPPTIREIAARFHIASPKGVQDHLRALENKGYIRREREKSRGIRLVKGAGSGIPLLGRIAAGHPILAIEHVEGELAFDELFGRTGVFAVRVVGDSMVDCGIRDGDYVVVRKADDIDNGRIGVAYINGEATVKRIYHTRKGYRLKPENAAMAPLHVNPAEVEFRIGGPVVGVVRRVN